MREREIAGNGIEDRAEHGEGGAAPRVALHRLSADVSGAERARFAGRQSLQRLIQISRPDPERIRSTDTRPFLLPHRLQSREFRLVARRESHVAALGGHRHGSAVIACQAGNAKTGARAQNGDGSPFLSLDVGTDDRQVLVDQHLRRKGERLEVVDQDGLLETELLEIALRISQPRFVKRAVPAFTGPATAIAATAGFAFARVRSK